MVAALSWLVFAGAGALALAVILYTVGPHWRRILRLAAGHHDPAPRGASGASPAPASSRPRAVEAGAGHPSSREVR